MSKLNVDQRTIFDLFSDRKSDFLIPDYQRPYAWGDKECQTLWDDIFSFAFPDNDYTKFDSDNDEYYLGPIVTFKNDDGKMEVIDGQQRLTTLMLLLRAFYEKFGKMQDENSINTRENLALCIWKTNEFRKPVMDKLKIDSEVATDNDKDEFLSILRSGVAPDNMKSGYAQNFRFFQNRINIFLNEYPSFFSYFPTRLLNNCIILPIEADNQNTALRIFSTLNDRGMPLSDADIFKAQFYKYYAQKGLKDEFISRWKCLEELCEEMFHPISGTPMDELFTRYMYYLRAKQGIKSSTTEALRKFFEKDKYAALNNNNALEELEELADFWKDVFNQNIERFSDRILRCLFVLNYAPNGMWSYIVSVYFLKNRNTSGDLSDAEFYTFLNKITAFIWAYSIDRPGVNALRTPVYAEMVNIIEEKNISFSEYKFDPIVLRSKLDNYTFANNRAVTKSMLTWWAFRDEEQSWIDLDVNFEIEHILSKKRQDELQDKHNLEILGNKTLLEKKINIRASDYRFADKVKYYRGDILDRKQNKKEGTRIKELLNIANTYSDFVEDDISDRNNEILSQFIKFLEENDLIK
ncbi:MAG: DUF262 domain-containing protein [Bacteroidales bacterium]|nr:DUF262 domain-containing protein [Bacteroidales bacterium]